MDEKYCDRSRKSLYIQNASLNRYSTEYSGYENARQKEEQGFHSMTAPYQSPNESCGKKAIVEPLVGGQNLTTGSLLSALIKNLEAQRFIPEVHLKSHERKMQDDYGDNCYQRKEGK